MDDETNSAEALEYLVKSYCPKIEILAIANSINEAREAIEKHSPDFIFLDIEMQGGSGFDLLKNFRNRNFDVIFTTAYQSYAIDALREGAIDYLLKPIDKDELTVAVERVRERREKDLNPKLDRVISLLSGNTAAKQKLTISTLEGITFIDTHQLIYLQSDSNYTIFYLSDGRKIVASRTLKEFENQLDSSLFLRVHSSFIVNLNFVERYNKGDGGSLTMKNGSIIEVSRRKKSEVLQRLIS